MAAIAACLAPTERTLYTRWRAIGFLARVRYEDQPPPVPASRYDCRPHGGGKGRVPRDSGAEVSHTHQAVPEGGTYRLRAGQSPGQGEDDSPDLPAW
jgi:hypothetical protein